MVIEDKLAKGTLSPNDVAVYREFNTTAASTCATLSQFKFGPTLVPATDYVTAANKSYMMLFTTGTVQGSGAQTMVFLDPVASSTNTMVAAPASGCEHPAVRGRPDDADAADRSRRPASGWSTGARSPRTAWATR